CLRSAPQAFPFRLRCARCRDRAQLHKPQIKRKSQPLSQDGWLFSFESTSLRLIPPEGGRKKQASACSGLIQKLLRRLAQLAAGGWPLQWPTGQFASCGYSALGQNFHGMDAATGQSDRRVAASYHTGNRKLPTLLGNINSDCNRGNHGKHGCKQG